METENTWKKHYIEILPTITLRWRPFGLTLMWLVWYVHFGENL